MGCRATRAYPIVPLDDGHGVSIGMTTVDGQACFGVYAQSRLAGDADRIAHAIYRSIANCSPPHSSQRRADTYHGVCRDYTELPRRTGVGGVDIIVVAQLPAAPS